MVAAPVSLDPYESNETVSNAYNLPCYIAGNSTTVSTTDANLHSTSDVDYYKINLNAGRNYTIMPRLYDSYNNGNSGIYYTVDAKFAYSTDGVTWSEFYDDEMGSSFTVSGGAIYFCVMPYFEGKTGTYLLDITVAYGAGVEEEDETLFSVYPNPTKDVVNMNCKDIHQVNLYNAVGQRIESVNTESRDNVQIDLSGLPNGVYILQAVSNGRSLTRRIVKAE